MKRTNIALAVCAVILAAVFLFMPFIQFSSQLYIKRSPNTFMGDEKYVSASEEVREELRGLQAQGIEGTIDEQVIERVNSKGETTSMVIFTILAANTRTGLDLLRAKLPASRVLAAVIVLGVLSLILSTAASFTGRRETKKGRVLGIAGFVCALAAFFLTPVVFLTINLNLSRSVDLYLAGNEVRGIETLLPALDDFLFGGSGGAGLDTLLGSLTYSICPAVLMMLLPGFIAVCASVTGAGMQLKKTLLRILLYVTVILFSIFILYPFFVMFITAFRSNAETTDMYSLRILPSKWVFSNLKDTLDRGVLRYLTNSLLIAGGATVVAMLCGIPAAYAMARMDFRGRKAYLGFVIMSQMFSPVVLLVGISRLMNTLRLNDTLLGLMFINAAFNQAFAIWLLRGTFVSISSEMEQAACIDGCSVVGALLRILLPMAAPGIVTTLIFVFINSWNEFTISTILISTRNNRPITVGITQFSSFNMIEWQYLFAAALLATVPVVILFMLIEKHLAAGLTAGGVKG